MSSVDVTLPASDSDATSASVPSEMVVAEGDKLGRYVVLSRVGAGMMGVVYAAFDPQLDRKVAVKVMNPALAGGAHQARTRKQMIREARALARIAHPNVVAVYDVGTVHDRVFIAMEFVEGQTLDQWLADRERPWPEVLAKMLEAGRGLVAAHEQGVVHCDFKPTNVIVGADDRVRVMDFGLARAQRRAAYDKLGQQQLRASTMDPEPWGPQGTPAYMAPEQYSLPGDARSDQFSFCVATWEALYGQRPFAGESPATLLRAALEGEIRDPPSATRVPAWIRGVLVRGFSARPDARFPSMAALLRTLQADPTRSRRWLIAGAALLVLAAAGGGVYWGLRAQASRDCDAFARQLPAPWDGQARATLESSLHAASLSYAADTVEHLLPVLDRYADRLRDEGLVTCRATRLHGALPSSLYERAEACFEERRAALEGVIAGIDAEHPDSVRNAVAVAAELPSVEVCGDRAWLDSNVALLPSEPEARATAIDLKTELASLMSFQAAADYAGGLAQARQVLEQAEALGWEPLVAEALIQVAFYSYTSGDAKAAEDAYTRAFEVASAIDRDDLAATSAAQTAQLLAGRLGRLEEAQVWARVARTRTTRSAQLDGAWKGTVANGRGTVAVRAEDWDTCLSEFQSARSIFAETYGPHHPQVARAMVNIATCLLSTERWEEGLRTQEQALEQLEQVVGANHPLVGLTLLNRARTLQAHGRLDQARVAADRAHTILTTAYDSHTVEARMAVAQRASLAHFDGRWEQALADYTALIAGGNTDQGLMRLFRALMLAYLGRFDEAEAEARLAIDERIAALGEDHPSLGPMYGAWAEIRLLHDDPQTALRYAQRALALAPTGYERADVLRQLAWAHERLGARTEAIEVAEQALALFADQPPHDPFGAHVRFILARAVHPDDPARARALAQQALASLRRTGGGFDRWAAEVEAWLHDPPPPT